MTPPAASTEAPGQQPETTLRADAERNRERIMEAARRLYATEGLGVSMASVAREAGVGKATLAQSPTSTALYRAMIRIARSSANEP